MPSYSSSGHAVIALYFEDTPQNFTTEIASLEPNLCILLVTHFEGCTVSYGPRFFPLQFMA